MGFTTNYANTILSSLVNGAYIALATTSPSATSTGNTIVEPSGGGYARAAVNSTSGGFTVSNRVLKNKEYIYFPEATASWGTITHMCICAAKTGGDLRYYGALNSSVSVGANTVPLFKPETISISLDAD